MYIVHKLQSFPPNRAQKMQDSHSQQLFFGLRFLNRVFEEHQQPAIQTTISSDHGLDTVFRNPNKKLRMAHKIQKNDKIRKTEKIKDCRYANRDPNNLEVGIFFV
jgi:hypothetical protein